jgi:hypothetical protein
LLPTFNKTVDSELLIMGVQQLEDVFSIVQRNFRAWINRSVLEEKDLSAERRKSERLPYSGECAGLRYHPSPYQFSRRILFFSEFDCTSTTNIRSNVGSKVMGMRTVQLLECELSNYGNANCPVIGMRTVQLWECELSSYGNANCPIMGMQTVQLLECELSNYGNASCPVIGMRTVQLWKCELSNYGNANCPVMGMRTV